MLDNINKNTVSETNALNEIKKWEIINKHLISGKKGLLNLFNNLFDAISSENKNNNNKTNSNTKNNNTNTNTTTTTTTTANNNNNNNNESVSESESESECE